MKKLGMRSILALATLTSVAAAEERNFALNIGGSGLFAEINKGGHGLALDAGYKYVNEAVGMLPAVGVGYRYHPSGGIGGMYVGGYLHSAGYDNGGPGNQFETTMVTGGLGYRWMIVGGLNINIGLALGRGYHEVKSAMIPTEAERAEYDLMKKSSKLVGTGELSIGYAF